MTRLDCHGSMRSTPVPVRTGAALWTTQLDRAGPVPLSRQLAAALRRAIAEGGIGRRRAAAVDPGAGGRAWAWRAAPSSPCSSSWRPRGLSSPRARRRGITCRARPAPAADSASPAPPPAPRPVSREAVRLRAVRDAAPRRAAPVRARLCRDRRPLYGDLEAAGVARRCPAARARNGDTAIRRASRNCAARSPITSPRRAGCAAGRSRSC